MQLPLKLPLDLMQTRWASLLNPVLANLLLQGNVINNVFLPTNTPQKINHKLGRLQIGWLITDQDGFCSIGRTEPFNDLTLTLESSFDVTINLWVF